MKNCLDIIEETFRLYGKDEVQMPPKSYLFFKKGDLRCMPAYLPSMKIAGVKNVSVHPSNKNKPHIMATITLFDPETGFPLAVMDGTHITNMRTGAAGGISAKYLSRENSAVTAFIGAGAQARTQLEALLIVRPGISKIAVYDINKGNINNFIKDAKTKYSVEISCANSVDEAIKEADIIVTTTPSRTPIVKAEYVREGTHINAIGADAPGKQELEPEILKKAKIVIDNWEQASHSGEINVPLSKGFLTQGDIYGDIGKIVVGEKPGRTSLEEITVFDSTGLAIQDISVANYIYRKIISSKELEEKTEKINFFDMV